MAKQSYFNISKNLYPKNKMLHNAIINGILISIKILISGRKLHYVIRGSKSTMRGLKGCSDSQTCKTCFTGRYFITDPIFTEIVLSIFWNNRLDLYIVECEISWNQFILSYFDYDAHFCIKKPILIRISILLSISMHI